MGRGNWTGVCVCVCYYYERSENRTDLKNVKKNALRIMRFVRNFFEPAGFFSLISSTRRFFGVRMIDIHVAFVPVH